MVVERYGARCAHVKRESDIERGVDSASHGRSRQVLCGNLQLSSDRLLQATLRPQAEVTPTPGCQVRGTNSRLPSRHTAVGTALSLSLAP